MAFVADYPADVRHIVGEVKGPDTGGAMYRAKSAEFDEETGRTRVEFELILPVGGAR